MTCTVHALALVVVHLTLAWAAAAADPLGRQAPCNPALSSAPAAAAAAAAACTSGAAAPRHDELQVPGVDAHAGVPPHAALIAHEEASHGQGAVPRLLLPSGGTAGSGGGTSASSDLDALDQYKLEGGTHATKRYVKTLADRHFAEHGAKWPSPEFVRAVRAAGMVVAVPGEAGAARRAGTKARSASKLSGGDGGEEEGEGERKGSGGSGGREEEGGRGDGGGGGGGAAAAASKRVSGGSGSGSGSGVRRVVLMAMTNDVALQHTVPLFLRSLAATPAASYEQASGNGGSGDSNSDEQASGNGGSGDSNSGDGGNGNGGSSGSGGGGGSGSGRVLAAGAQRSLADHLVLACSSDTAAQTCRELGLGDRCVLDADMALGNKSLPFHSLGFNMIGFGKVKYILNALSLGYDVIFMDTDVVVFSNFVPYILSMGADMAATIEKCKVVDDHADYSGRSIKGFPMFNIGVTYFRASPGVMRCAYNWLYDMWMEVRDRPRVWDQDVFRKVMFHCTKQYGVRLHAFSPRLLNSYCYKPCGCNYTDKDLQTRVDAQLRPVGLASSEGNGTCPSRVVARWMLMHFPCAGETHRKAHLMQQFLQSERQGAGSSKGAAGTGVVVAHDHTRPHVHKRC